MKKRISSWIISTALKTPYTHLLRADGSAYMRRYWLVPFRHLIPLKFRERPFGWLLQRLGIAIRVHNICAPDADRAMHDHPWSFLSVVLEGGYRELRPADMTRPCFAPQGAEEAYLTTYRRRGSVGFRRATDRHRISYVEPGTWTLFLTGPMRQWWGFYTPKGKIYYRDYNSEHEAITEGANHA